MGAGHSMLRSAIDSIHEANRLLERFNKKDVNYVFTNDDLYSIRNASVMATQGARSIAELSGFVEAKVRGT